MYSGEELYGAIYSPEKLEEGVKVPTIVYVYGGPCVQVLTHYCDSKLKLCNCFIRWLLVL